MEVRASEVRVSWSLSDFEKIVVVVIQRFKLSGGYR